MLFYAVGQGYIFLLLLCAGAALGLVEILCKIVSRSLKNLPKIKSKKIAEKSKINPPPPAQTERKIVFVAPQKNKEKNTKKIPKKLSQKSKNILRNSCCAALSAGRVLIYSAALFWVILMCDYGEIRAYHFLAFWIGFWLTKTIFAKHLRRRINCAKL